MLIRNTIKEGRFLIMPTINSDVEKTLKALKERRIEADENDFKNFTNYDIRITDHNF